MKISTKNISRILFLCLVAISCSSMPEPVNNTIWYDRPASNWGEAFCSLVAVMKWTPFLVLYSDLKDITQYIALNHAKISKAHSQIAGLTNEEQLIQWLVNHEEIGNEAPFLLKHTFKKQGNYYRWNYTYPIHFIGEGIHGVLYFLEYYEKYYTEMFQKYTTYKVIK